ncbi:Panacea domain-containing protein [Bradyrhizobium sp. LB13.1]
MFVSRDREKLINAIIYFLGATNHCHTLKLFKLLNFADFEHFRQTGRTIFNLDYKALPKGPVCFSPPSSFGSSGVAPSGYQRSIIDRSRNSKAFPARSHG